MIITKMIGEYEKVALFTKDNLEVSIDQLKDLDFLNNMNNFEKVFYVFFDSRQVNYFLGYNFHVENKIKNFKKNFKNDFFSLRKFKSKYVVSEGINEDNDELIYATHLELTRKEEDK